MNTEQTKLVTPEFVGFPKIARFSRESIITEKIDGTNAQILITSACKDYSPEYVVGELAGPQGECLSMYAGSRTRWLKSGDDNFGFWAWAREHFDELKTLGEGHHFGEWWGRGIQRNYGLKDRRFSLFNVSRWCLHGEEPARIEMADPRIEKKQDVLPPCVGLVPVIFRGILHTDDVAESLDALIANGSVAAPGFMKPEGIVIYHTAGNVAFKKTIEKDESPKGKQ